MERHNFRTIWQRCSPPYRESQPSRDQNHFVVLSEGEPRAFLFIKPDTSPVLQLPDKGMDEVKEMIGRIFPDQYKVETEGNTAHYSSGNQSHDPLFILLDGDRTFGIGLRLPATLSDSEQRQRSFFWELADLLYQRAEIVPLSDWNVKTVSDLEFLSYMYGTVDDKEGLKEKIQNSYVKVLATDTIMADVLQFCRVENPEGDVLFSLNADIDSDELGSSHCQSRVVWAFPAASFYYGGDRQKRWAIAASLGYLVKGKDSVSQRRLSDMILAFFTYSSDPKWDPGEDGLRESEEPDIRNSLRILSLIWKLFPREKRREAVLALWRNDFGKDDVERALNFVKIKGQTNLKHP